MSTFRAVSIGRPYDDTLGDLLGDLDREAFSLSPLPSSHSHPSSDSSSHSHNPLPTKHMQPHRDDIHQRRQRRQRRQRHAAHKAPVAFLTAFVLVVLVEARLLSMCAADADLAADGRERARLVASAAFMYVLDGMVLLGGYFADCGRAWWAFLDLVTCGAYQGPVDDDDDEDENDEDDDDDDDDDCLGSVGDEATTGSEDEVGESCTCTSTGAIETLLGVEMGMLLIAVWPLALAWIAILWWRDGVECADPDVEEATADDGPAAGTREQGRRRRRHVSSTAADEQTPLLDGPSAVADAYYGHREEISVEEAMALSEEEAAEKRRAYAELMGSESIYGEF
ncbi:hypothetical protein CTA2_3028 [Colletotrichum tanaceti]|nr:hypothetical protein CTA2_3028 [Colletotrichum tanaceti]